MDSLNQNTATNSSRAFGVFFTIITALFISLHGSLSAQNQPDSIELDRLRIGFYNLQNLFDTINDPGVNDAEFLNPKQYNYQSKIKELSCAIGLLSADILGICEVENYGVLEDLTSQLREDSIANYNIVHYDSRDSRGIDVALLYKPEKIEIHSSELMEFNATTRGFLRTEFRGDSLNDIADGLIVYVAHLPSKRGGAKSQKRRERAAEILDSLALSEPSLRVVVCGDFNDTPQQKRILENLAYPLQLRGVGSYAYRDVWSMLDQIIITPELKRYIIGEQRVLFHNSLLTPNGRFRGYPARNHPSDHLPVYLDLRKF